VRNIDMASAYCTIAAQGQRAEAHTVEEVKTSDGDTRYKARPKKTRVFSKDVMADATYALQQVVRNGTGTEALNLGRPAAAKTGTAALRPDTTTSAWFVGFTPQLCAAVDFYKGTGKADLDGVGGLSTFFGGEYPARVWTAFMTAAMEGKKIEEFPPRADVGETLNPKPSKTPKPTTSSPTPTTVSPTPTPTKTKKPKPTQTPSPSGTITISPLAPGEAPGARNGGP
jgi:membrane peptidoglycan carboxypeptidase